MSAGSNRERVFPGVPSLQSSPLLSLDHLGISVLLRGMCNDKDSRTPLVNKRSKVYEFAPRRQVPSTHWPLSRGAFRWSKLLGHRGRRLRGRGRGMVVDIGPTTAVVRGKRGSALGALVVHVLERRDHVRDAAEADDAAGEQGHQVRKATRLITDGGHALVIAVGALHRRGLGGEADDGHTVHAVVLRAEDLLGDMLVRHLLLVHLLLLRVRLGGGLLHVAGRGHHGLAGALGGHDAHLVLLAGDGWAVAGYGGSFVLHVGEVEIVSMFRDDVDRSKD